MKYIMSMLLLCAMVAPIDAQRRGSHSKRQEAHKKATVTKGCSECASLKKELEALKKRVTSTRKTTSRGSKRGGRTIGGRTSRRGSSQRDSSSKKDKSVRRGGYGRRLDTEYEGNLRDRLKKAIEAKKLTREQAAKIIQSRKNHMDAPKKKDTRMPVIPAKRPGSDVRRYKKVLMDAIYQGRKYS